MTGTPVVDGDGETIGVVTAVEDGTAYVEPNPGLADSVRVRLG